MFGDFLRSSGRHIGKSAIKQTGKLNKKVGKETRRVAEKHGFISKGKVKKI